MNTIQTDTAIFDSLRFILCNTSHPGNVGAVARAIKTMGFSDLVLVNPRFPDICNYDDAIAFASGALDVLGNTRVVTSIEEATRDCQLLAGVSARLREFSPPVMTPRHFASHIKETPVGRTGIVFGSERMGLPNEIVRMCHTLIHIPANPDYSSLNLAQAVQVVAYELRQTLWGETHPLPDSGFYGKAASIPEIEGMFAHLEEALLRIEFLNPDHPKKLIPRLRRLFARRHLEVEEVNIMRGIAHQILLKTSALPRDNNDTPTSTTPQLSS